MDINALWKDCGTCMKKTVAGIAEAWRGRDMTNKEVAGRRDWHIDMAKANW